MGERLKSSPLRREAVARRVVLVGTRDLMFDRYPGDNDTKLVWWQKVYLDKDGATLCLPALNVMSFFTAHNTNSAPKRLRDKRKYKDVCNAILSFLQITGDMIPITRDGAPVRLGKINGHQDPESGLYLARHVARLDKGVPNPKERPVLPVPWELRFDLQIWPNEEIQEQEILNLLEEGGRAIGLGTFRGVFGKFRVDTWE